MLNKYSFFSLVNKKQLALLGMILILIVSLISFSFLEKSDDFWDKNNMVGLFNCKYHKTGDVLGAALTRSDVHAYTNEPLFAVNKARHAGGMDSYFAIVVTCDLDSKAIYYCDGISTAKYGAPNGMMLHCRQRLEDTAQKS